MPKPQKDPIYSHTLPPSYSLLSLLHRYLPYTIPILRRLQSPIGFSPTAILLATFAELPKATGLHLEHDIENYGETDLALPFAIGYFDRGLKPNIHGWVFSSFELPASFSAAKQPVQALPKHDDGEMAAKLQELAANQMLSLFATLARLRPIESPPHVELTGEDLTREELAKQAARSLFLGLYGTDDTIFLGGVNAKIESLLLTHPSQPFVRRPGRYTKHIIDVGRMRRNAAKAGADTRDDLPSGMYFASITADDYDIVMYHNKLIRHPKNIEGLPNCGIWLSTQPNESAIPLHKSLSGISLTQDSHDCDEKDDQAHENKFSKQSKRPQDLAPRRREGDQLIAFAFLGADGCVRALHVDFDFRGQGLGAKIVKRLILTSNHMFYIGAPLPLPTTTSSLDMQLTDKAEQDEGNDVTDWTKGDMTHADIYAENDVSMRLFKKFGAVAAWDAIWPTIDLGRITTWFDKDEA